MAIIAFMMDVTVQRNGEGRTRRRVPGIYALLKRRINEY
jgi:hypothetical protein